MINIYMAVFRQQMFFNLSLEQARTYLFSTSVTGMLKDFSNLAGPTFQHCQREPVFGERLDGDIWYLVTAEDALMQTQDRETGRGLKDQAVTSQSRSYTVFPHIFV